MALLPILTAPDPRLKKKSKPVETVDAELRQLMDDMLETMYAAPGIGLAAIQVGVPKRVIVMDLARGEEPPAPREGYGVPRPVGGPGPGCPAFQPWGQIMSARRHAVLWPGAVSRIWM